MTDAQTQVLSGERDRIVSTNGSTRRIYDLLASVYHVSASLFHSRAHYCVLDCADLHDGMRILEVATGSGEMFFRVVAANGKGKSLGVDVSPNMASQTQKRARKAFPNAQVLCQAVDARRLPFQDSVIDRIICCYLLELLSAEDIRQVLREFYRVLGHDGRLTLVCVGERLETFNRAYRLAGRIAPALWGRQIDRDVPELIEGGGSFRIIDDRAVQQAFYPSHVWIIEKESV